MQKNVYTGLVTGSLMKRALQFGIKRGANKQEGGGDCKNKSKLITGGAVINKMNEGREGGYNFLSNPRNTNPRQCYMLKIQI